MTNSFSDKCIGVVVPARNTVAETECHKLAPPGVKVISERSGTFANKEWRTAEDVAAMVKANTEGELAALGRLQPAAPGCVIIAETTPFASVADEEKHRKLYEEEACCPVIFWPTAFLEAFERENAGQRIGLISPMKVDLRDFVQPPAWQAHGFEVTAVKGMGFESADAIARTNKDDLTLAVERIAQDGVDAVVIRCTNFQIVDFIEELTNRIGVPVLSSNIALMQSALSVIQL